MNKDFIKKLILLVCFALVLTVVPSHSFAYFTDMDWSSSSFEIDFPEEADPDEGADQDAQDAESGSNDEEAQA